MEHAQSIRSASCLRSFASARKQRILIFPFWETDPFHSMNFSVLQTDKIKKAGWHAAKSEFVDAPVFDELPMALECSLISYNKESGILVGKIVNICADDKILDSDGKIDLSKFNPITFDPANHKYLKIGEDVGNAFKDGMKLK